MSVKFSQFNAAALLLNTDIAVGLRGLTNTKFPIIGIGDSAGNKIITWTQTVGTNTNWIDFANNNTGLAPTITAKGADPNVNLSIGAQGLGHVFFAGTGAIGLPVGTTLQDPIPFIGGIRFDSDTGFVRYSDGANWFDIINGAAFNTASYITQTDELTNLPNSQPLSAQITGFLHSTTGTGVILNRIMATADPSRIIIANPAGILGNPTWDLAVSGVVPGSYLNTSLTVDAYGRITAASTGVTGVTNVTGQPNQIDSSGGSTPHLTLSSTIIAPGSLAVTSLTANTAIVANATKNLTSVPLVNGQLLIGSTGTTPVGASLTAGSGVTITPGPGSITISAVGSGGTVTSVAGFPNQINSTGGAAPVLTLSSTITTPGTLAVSSLTASSAIIADASKILTSVPLANGQLLIGSNGATPLAANLTAGTGISISSGPGSITINATATGTAGAVTTAVTQVNSFTGGQWVYLNGGTYTLAANTSVVTAEVVGVVAFSPAPTGTTFTLQTNGELTGSSGLTAGTVNFLGIGGALTTTPPTAIGSVVKPLLVANSTTSGIMINFRGDVNAAVALTPYDAAFVAGFNTSGVAANVVVQTYGNLVMARTGSFTGDVGMATTAPTGAAMILDIEKNGTTIYTTKPQFAISATTMTSGILKIDGTQNFVSGDVITFKITQIGSTIPGQGVKFTAKATTGLI